MGTRDLKVKDQKEAVKSRSEHAWKIEHYDRDLESGTINVGTNLDRDCWFCNFSGFISFQQ